MAVIHVHPHHGRGGNKQPITWKPLGLRLCGFSEATFSFPSTTFIRLSVFLTYCRSLYVRRSSTSIDWLMFCTCDVEHTTILLLIVTFNLKGSFFLIYTCVLVTDSVTKSVLQSITVIVTSMSTEENWWRTARVFVRSRKLCVLSCVCYSVGLSFNEPSLPCCD